MKQESVAPASPAEAGMNRRQFLATLTSLAAVGFAMQVIGCIEDAPATATAGSAGGGTCALAKAAADRSGTVAANHGHVAVVTTAQQDAGTAFDLSIQGTAPHNHTLSLTTQDLADLKAGAQVVKTSSTNSGHSHVVTFAAVTTSIRPPEC